MGNDNLESFVGQNWKGTKKIENGKLVVDVTYIYEQPSTGSSTGNSYSRQKSRVGQSYPTGKDYSKD